MKNEELKQIYGEYGQSRLNFITFNAGHDLTVFMDQDAGVFGENMKMAERTRVEGRRFWAAREDK